MEGENGEYSGIFLIVIVSNTKIAFSTDPEWYILKSNLIAILVTDAINHPI